MNESTVAAIAAEVFSLLGAGRQTMPFTTRHPDLDLAAAYHVASVVRELREGQGERPVGRKIGFTNSTIWNEYNVHAPIWGYVYDTTLHDLGALEGPLPLGRYAEPRIEPEIVFRFHTAPQP